jgi:inhibitor of cysteine peptidase
VCAFLLAGLLVGCPEARIATQTMNEEIHANSLVTIGDSDSGKTITVPKGDKVIVRLASNPTTGYQWQIRSLDQEYLMLVGEPMYDPSKTDRIGSGGTQVFTFITLKPGKTMLVLDYKRSWEKKPIKNFTVAVQIGNSS